MWQNSRNKGYPARTEANVVNSDVTLAFAQDFNSAGEKLTKRLCIAHNKLYIPIDLNNRIMTIYRMNCIINGIQTKVDTSKVLVFNGLGNGIYSLPDTQENLNTWFVHFLRDFFEHPQWDIKPYEVCSGGQTGVDEAFVLAADYLGYNGIVRAPKGYLFRGKNHVDISSEELFKKRFI